MPTGGGKTFTFWLPAIIKAKRTRALTVVISPLQALMKDHIFNFNKKLSGLASAEALSGYLTMPERRTIIKKVINGAIDILYLAPESLRHPRRPEPSVVDRLLGTHLHGRAERA